MGLLTSPVVLAGIVITTILAYSVYSSNIERKRYVNLGAGPPKILPSNTFGRQYKPYVFTLADFEKG